MLAWQGIFFCLLWGYIHHNYLCCYSKILLHLVHCDIEIFLDFRYNG